MEQQMLGGSGRQRNQHPAERDRNTPPPTPTQTFGGKLSETSTMRAGRRVKRCMTVQDKHEQHDHLSTVPQWTWKQGGRHAFRGTAGRSEARGESQGKMRHGAAMQCDAVQESGCCKNKAGVKPTRDRSSMHTVRRQPRRQTHAFGAKGSCAAMSGEMQTCGRRRIMPCRLQDPKARFWCRRGEARRGKARQGSKASDHDSDGAGEQE
ncbi:uncharacterized protein PSANT_06957 [Moesziomyces antarcticus]|uniref:Uncharacterized protein n=1 Tax=Pseudozyma antarctica TaxID=84753 RepID=A0A5C3FYK3_PSEA2|nr:uncharacterized protein PSANT_06957 [Moesziomyces antarcticus]